MISIYKITDCNGLCYVGSTKQTVKRRLSKHCYEKRHSTRYCSSSKLDLENSEIEVLETCNPEIRYEREKHYINTIDCVNVNNYTYDEKKSKNKYQKKYYEKNKDKIKEYKKEINSYEKSWGGDKRTYNNLLMIDVNLFQ